MGLRTQGSVLQVVRGLRTQGLRTQGSVLQVVRGLRTQGSEDTGVGPPGCHGSEDTGVGPPGCQGAEDTGVGPLCARSNHTSDLNTDTPVAALPCSRTGWPSVSLL